MLNYTVHIIEVANLTIYQLVYHIYPRSRKIEDPTHLTAPLVQSNSLTLGIITFLVNFIYVHIPICKYCTDTIYTSA